MNGPIGLCPAAVEVWLFFLAGCEKADSGRSMHGLAQRQRAEKIILNTVMIRTIDIKMSAFPINFFTNNHSNGRKCVRYSDHGLNSKPSNNWTQP